MISLRRRRLEVYPKRRTSVSWILVGACITLLATFLWTAVFRDYLVMQEARQYYTGEFYPTISPLGFFLMPEGANSRYVSMLFSSTIANIAGPSTAFINVSQIAVLGLGLFFLFCHSIQVTENLTASVFAFVLTILSWPTLNLLLWQSLQHDKIMIVFSTLSLIVHFSFIRREKVTWPQSIVVSVVMILIVSLANNSKETAIFIPVALAAQIMLFTMRSGRYDLDHKLLLPFASIVIYDIVFFYDYFSHLNPDWGGHISGGNTYYTLRTLIAYVLNSGNFMSLIESGFAHRLHMRSFGVAAAGLVELAALIGFRLLRLHNNRSTVTFDINTRGGLYFLVVGGAVLAATSRVSHPDAYHMLIPQWSLGMILGLFAASPERNLLRGGLATAAVLALLLAGQAIAFSAHFMPGGIALRLLTYSRNLQDSLVIIKTLAPASSTSSLQIGYPDGLDSVWYLVMGMNQKVDPFIGVYIYGIPSASAPKILEPGATGSLEGCARFDLDTMYHVSLRKQCTR